MLHTGEEMISLYEEYCEQYPIVSIEDPFHQDDFTNSAKLTALGICQVIHNNHNNDCIIINVLMPIKQNRFTHLRVILVLTDRGIGTH
jgi:hypothetical protein